MHPMTSSIPRFVSRFLAVSLVSGCSVLPSDSRVCTAEFRFGLIVTVVDSLTASPPSSAVLIARSGAFVDSVGPYAPQPLVLNGPPVLILPTAGERAGTYDITVRAPGYRDWTRTSVRVTADECHVQPTGVTAKVQR